LTNIGASIWLYPPIRIGGATVPLRRNRTRSIMEDYAWLCINALISNALISADEHAQTSCQEPEHGERHSLGPLSRWAQTPQKQHAGLLELDAQPSAASIRPP
jgi:hypothetical protein